jgi:hypothetical protein
MGRGLNNISCSAYVVDLHKDQLFCTRRDLTRSAVLHHTRGLNKKISCSAWVVGEDLARSCYIFLGGEGSKRSPAVCLMSNWRRWTR